MKFEVLVKKTDEGYSVCCPSLPGCWSQGASEKEALENIKDAIKSALPVVREMYADYEARIVDVRCR